MLRTLFVTAVMAGLCLPVLGQAKPAGGGGVWQVGAGFSFGTPDYTLPYIKGITGYASYDLSSHSGMIVEIHDLDMGTPQRLGESSFLVGGRYNFNQARFHLYVKALVGIGLFQPKQGFVNPPSGTAAFEVFAAGVGMEYTLSPHINLRIGDFEYQGWPAFQKDGLTPWIVTTGAAYRF
jgi:hypothetical protein